VEAPNTPIKSEPEEAEPAVEEHSPENTTELNTKDPLSDGEAASPSSRDPRSFQYPDPYDVPKEETASGGNTETDKPLPEQPDASEAPESTDTRERQGTPSTE
jgi:hypothetical protein